MAIYGNMLLTHENFDTRSGLDIGDFLSFVQETTYDIDLMFEKVDMIHVLKEENTSLTIPNEFKFEPEKMKKTLLEKVKEIYSNFIAMIKKAFTNLAEVIHKKYMETNLQDKYISRFKDIVTFDNLKKAKNNGWVGVHASIPMINKLADVRDSQLYSDINEGLFETDDEYINIERDIDPIAKSQSISDAKEKYQEFEKKLKKFKSDSRKENNVSYGINNVYTAAFKGVQNAYYTVTNDKSEDGKYYFPNPEGFIKTKKLAEEGQSIIKQYKNSNQAFIKNIKMNKDVEMQNLKSFKSSGSNVTDDKDSNQIMIMYYKARYKFTAAFVQRSTKILDAVISLIKTQHSYAIISYMVYVHAIKKYVIKEA